MKTYKCDVCGEEWEFVAEDYGYKKEFYPKKCVFCSGSILWTIKELLRNRDLGLLMRVLLGRIKKKWRKRKSL